MHILFYSAMFYRKYNVNLPAHEKDTSVLLNVTSLCHQYRTRSSCTSRLYTCMHAPLCSLMSDQVLYCWLANIKLSYLYYCSLSTTHNEYCSLSNVHKVLLYVSIIHWVLFTVTIVHWVLLTMRVVIMTFLLLVI